MKNSTLLALATGAAIGAIVALLVAPCSGEELRQKIKEFSDKQLKDISPIKDSDDGE